MATFADINNESGYREKALDQARPGALSQVPQAQAGPSHRGTPRPPPLRRCGDPAVSIKHERTILLLCFSLTVENTFLPIYGCKLMR